VPRTALIVGAGIGGLSAGIALQRIGWRVRIFERAPSARELGFGLGLAPNAVAALAELGLADTVLARAYAPTITRGELRRLDGTVLKSLELPIRELLGGTFAIALRPALHCALMEAVGSGAIAVESEAIGFGQNGHTVELRLANGSTAEGDVLVGADGIGSTIRRTLHSGEPPPRSSGIVAVRGAVHGALHHLGDRSAIYYLDRGLESMIIRASDTGIYWFLSLARELAPAGVTDPREFIRHMAPRFDATFRAIASATEDLRYDELVDRDALPWWGTGLVTLLGDAAHPLLPHTGQGAAQAIVDGVRLAHHLRDATDVPAALRAYEAERRPKTAALLAQGRRTARIMRMTNPIGCAIRDWVVRHMPVARLAKIYVRINKKAGTQSVRS
jgi:2-polyprenyl-6-methoxyphenol hydroxylase-like FAD-dependent oxidoreductase